MNTFEEAQALALKARQAIDKLEARKAEISAELATKRAEFVSYEQETLESVYLLDSDIGEARRELQAALQRQNDAPLQADAAPAAEPVVTGADGGGTWSVDPVSGNLVHVAAAISGEPVRVNPFNGATERLGG